MIFLKNIAKPFFLWVLIFFISSCGENEEKESQIKLPTKEESSDMNKVWNEEEHYLIEQFVKRNEWEVIETGTGLRYMIYEKGTGEYPEPEQRAMIDFSITLLDGTECYSTKESGPVPFTIEHDYVESGLHEGILKMKVGDRAKLIIPSYLAHGLAGDQEKIPTLATIIYDIRLLGVSN